MPRKSSRKSSTSSSRSGTRRRSSTSRSSRSRSSGSSKRSTGGAASLSPRTKKQIDTLPAHARTIYKKAHKNALKQYKSPAKRRGGKKQSREQVAHKVAWSAVKRKYQKEGDSWVPKD